ncbi:hypothetical protein D3C80_1931710 [compost metagenome]
MALLFGTTDVGGVAAGVALAQGYEFFVDPVLQLGTLAKQQGPEELLLRGIHIVIRRLSEKLGFGEYCGHGRVPA